MLAVLALLSFSHAAHAGPTGEPEPELRRILQQAISGKDGFEDRFDAEVWLSDMSDRLSRFVPAALPKPRERVNFLRLLHREAARAGVPPELALSVVEIESRFDRFAISRVGALGYMQIMPFWLEELGQPGDNLFHADVNLRMGCTILKYYLDQEHGEMVPALARYNGSYGKPDYPYRVLNALSRRWFRK